MAHLPDRLDATGFRAPCPAPGLHRSGVRSRLERRQRLMVTGPVSRAWPGPVRPAGGQPLRRCVRARSRAAADRQAAVSLLRATLTGLPHHAATLAHDVGASMGTLEKFDVGL
ncbi:hypothetical protein QMK19_27780 [Streptomyces sp. H10-C2]|nr:hypothetical protein [Streptomyces sp. PH10-H1]MDJ0373353.1 hypothetical protein [Streptomyces sp. H10-C2]